jgi:hypothetical protein
MLTFFSQKLPKYFCNKCNIKTNNKKDYDKHLLTSKHSKLTGINTMLTNSSLKDENIDKFMCQFCNKEYKSRVGLWKHKKKCLSVKASVDSISDVESKEQIIQNNILSNKDESQINNLIIEMIKSNTELQKENSEFKQMLIDQNKQIIELAKNAGNNTINNTTNSHNKAFNLNFFLNETCKDAMNIMDFVDSIKLQLSDLENVGKLGYVNGISNIIVKNLKELDVEKRPVHCTDKKRETMYVKDENKWEKDEKNSKISKAIKKVVSKNQRLIPKFKEAHPDCNTYHSKFSDQYNKLILESCGGSGDNDLEKEEKIIQNISKNVLVDK